MKKLILLFLVFIALVADSRSDYQTWAGLSDGVNGRVYAIAEYNGKLIFGGGFSTAGGVPVNNVAVWNPETGWSALGGGFNDTVYALHVFNGFLYAGGRFTHSGGTIVNRIARWNGADWQAQFMGTDDEVRAITDYNGFLFIGGAFVLAGGQPRSHVAYLNGGWMPLGTSNNGVNSDVYALTVFSSKLYIGGRFTSAGGQAAFNIASWDFSSLEPVGGGVNDRVHALTSYSGQLVVAGRFTMAGATPANRIALWNGASWSSLGTGMDDRVYSVTTFNGQLIAGGLFRTAGGSYVDRIAAWNGSNWSRLLTGMNGGVYSTLSANSILYAGGSFSTAAGKYIKYAAQWTSVPVFTISGEVRFADNNQPVSSGHVKAVRLDANTREIITLDSAQIISGAYDLTNVPAETSYVISFPDDEELNLQDTGSFVPTYHPSTIDWQNAVRVYATQNLNNININVFRQFAPEVSLSAGTVSGSVFLNHTPSGISIDTLPYKGGGIVYAVQNGLYRRFGVSNNNERYTLGVLPSGTFDMTGYRLGYTHEDRQVAVGNYDLDTVNFYLDPTNAIIGIRPAGGLIPSTMTLHQNYPNPFNPVTIIEFELPSRQEAVLRLYDVLGREAALIFRGQLEAGRYEVTFDASGLSTGIYFYTLAAGGHQITRKMTLIK